MLFFYASEDLHLRSNSRSELLNLLTLRYFTFNRNQTLRIYSVSAKDLIKYSINNSASQKIHGVFDIPPDETRLLDQEIKGEDEYNEELRMQREGSTDNSSIEKEPFHNQVSGKLNDNEGKINRQ